MQKCSGLTLATSKPVKDGVGKVRLDTPRIDPTIGHAYCAAITSAGIAVREVGVRAKELQAPGGMEETLTTRIACENWIWD
jgi:hypothetical protein